MNTGSLVELITSVDLMPFAEFFRGPVLDLTNLLFGSVGDFISLWPAGSTGVAGSLQDAIGSVSGT